MSSARRTKVIYWGTLKTLTRCNKGCPLRYNQINDCWTSQHMAYRKSKVVHQRHPSGALKTLTRRNKAVHFNETKHDVLAKRQRLKRAKFPQTIGNSMKVRRSKSPSNELWCLIFSVILGNIKFLVTYTEFHAKVQMRPTKNSDPNPQRLKSPPKTSPQRKRPWLAAPDI